MNYKNLSPEINAAIAESELQGGVFIDKLPLGRSLKVQTQNTLYTIERREDGLYMSGHYKYCPKPTKVNILGSNFGGSMLKVGFIGRGMYMEFFIDMPEEERHRGIVDGHGTIVTSKITEVEEV
jgi:hypothetical protein